MVGLTVKVFRIITDIAHKIYLNYNIKTTAKFWDASCSSDIMEKKVL